MNLENLYFRVVARRRKKRVEKSIEIIGAEHKMNPKDIECKSSCAYPLKIISMDDFFLNLDNMICNRVYYQPGTSPDKSENMYKFEQDLSDPNKATVLFIDSRNYRLSFEKSHLRLMSNLVVYDR